MKKEKKARKVLLAVKDVDGLTQVCEFDSYQEALEAVEILKIFKCPILIAWGD